MMRKLTRGDRLLSSLCHLLESADRKESSDVVSTPLNYETAGQLRGHQAMTSAARAWSMGRQISGASQAETPATATHARRLAASLDKHQEGRSLLLPAMWAGGFILGAGSRLLGQSRAAQIDEGVRQRAKRAQHAAEECMINAEVSTAPEESATTQQPDTTTENQTAGRRRQYSLRAGHSPSERLVNSIVGKACDSLFDLTRRL